MKKEYWKELVDKKLLISLQPQFTYHATKIKQIGTVAVCLCEDRIVAIDIEDPTIEPMIITDLWSAVNAFQRSKK